MSHSVTPDFETIGDEDQNILDMSMYTLQPDEPASKPARGGYGHGAIQTLPMRKLKARLPENFDASTVNGQFLRQLRESVNASFEDISRYTKINHRHLEALENEKFAELPSSAYVRGFVRNVAQSLGVDPTPIANGYMANYYRAQSVQKR